jgi:hypothetical protein
MVQPPRWAGAGTHYRVGMHCHYSAETISGMLVIATSFSLVDDPS